MHTITSRTETVTSGEISEIVLYITITALPKEFDNDSTLNCVLGAESHIAVFDAAHGDGIGGHCAVTAAGVCPLCVNDGIDIKEREILKKPTSLFK